MRREVGDVFSKQDDVSGIARQVAGDQVEERGLAGAVGADDQAPLARRHLERDIADGRQAAERFPQVLEAKRSHSLFTPGTTPSGMNTTMRTKTKPSSMFQRSTYAETQFLSSMTMAAPTRGLASVPEPPAITASSPSAELVSESETGWMYLW